MSKIVAVVVVVGSICLAAIIISVPVLTAFSFAWNWDIAWKALLGSASLIEFICLTGFILHIAGEEIDVL